MKRLLLLIMAMMAFTGMSVAQTVYTAGYYTNEFGKTAAVVFQDGEVFQELSSQNFDFRCTALAVADNGDVYWARCANDGTEQYADILLNGESSPYLVNTVGTDIVDMAFDASGNLYSVGSCKNSDGIKQAAIWKNDEMTPYALFGDGTRHCLATGVFCDGDDVYTCGYMYWQDGGETRYTAYVWLNDDETPTIAREDVRFNDIDVDRYIWTVGSRYMNDALTPTVFRNGVIMDIYDVGIEGVSQLSNRIKTDCTDIYYTTFAVTQGGIENNRVWKNGEALYSPDNAYDISGLDVTEEGVYYAVTVEQDYYGVIYKDGEQLWAPEKLEGVDGMVVVPAACDNEVRTLPYYEGFEMGATDWTCWDVNDVDEQNSNEDGDYYSYWHRSGTNTTEAYTGDYCVWHQYGPQGVEQEGWLISPIIFIPEGGPVTLTFWSFEGDADDYEYEGVWVANEDNHSGIEVWHATDEDVSGDWKPFDVDLSAFMGQEIVIGFKYQGNYAHSWFIDDINITQDAPLEYTITTEVDPVGAGTVTGADTYPAGEHVFLTATPNPGWRFSHWNDGVVTNPREIVVDGDAHYIATFLQENYTLTVVANPSDGGVVTGAGTNYHYGDMVTLTAMPNTGYNFVNWNDGSTDALRTVEVTGNAAYVANFSQAGATMYTVSVSTNDASLGSVIGGGTYPEGTNIQIQAIPVSNARFVKWDDGNTDNPRNITVTQNMSFVAEFEVIQSYTITVQSSNLTMGSVVGGGTFPEGTVIQISAIANPGYYFTSWNDNNAENPRTITVKENATYIAQFSENQIATYTVTTICNPEEGMVVGSGEYTLGATVTLVAIPNSGFEFDKWNDGNTDNPRTITVTGNITYVAFFKNTGIDEGSETRFALYPNPANDCIYLEGIEANSEVRIYNTMGALVKVVNANANEEIGIGDLSNGLYVVRCGNAMMRFVKK